MYIENKTHDFVRIVNNNNTHWLCVAGGLYIATALCNEIDIETLQFDENEMIKHWIRCIKEKKASMFPHKLKTRVNNTLHQIIRYKRDDF